MNIYVRQLEKAKQILGSYEAIGQACGGLTGKAVMKWKKNGKPPRTEYTGETNYAEQIEKATNGQVTKEQLRPKVCFSANKNIKPVPKVTTAP